MASPIRMTGLTSGLDTESIVSALVSNYSSKVEKYNKQKTKLEWKQDAWKDINTKVYSLYTSLSNLRYSSAYNLRSTSVSDSSKAKVTADSSAPIGTHSLKVESLATSAYITSAKVKTADGSKVESKTKLSDLVDAEGNKVFSESGTIKLHLNAENKDVDIKVDNNTTVQSFVNQLTSAGLNASFDEKNQRLYIGAKKSGEANDFSITADEENAGLKALSVLGLGNITSDIDPESDDYKNGNYAYKVTAQDGKISLDGVTYTSSDNNYAVNGLNISAQSVTNDPITITTSTDTQGIYDKIKEFLSQYNEVINELTSKYNAESAKGYEPLTDDEKAAMSEAQIEKYEDKIKASLLRRDGTLDGLMSAMTRAMSASYEVNGQKYSLTAFGIHTLGILNASDNEQYAMHIDGDKDDSKTGDQKDKLMKAITEDPEGLVGFMQSLAKGLYENLDVKMKSTTMSSAYTIYNDKEMKTQLQDYTKLIATWQKKQEDMEDYYYHKFSKMETALSNLNSNSTAITGMFQ